jgi:membrane protein DedA with SNARE-associated domain
MPKAMEFLSRHGYVVLCVTVLVKQIGLPVPSVPFLVAAGALAGLHRLSPPEAIALEGNGVLGKCVLNDRQRLVLPRQA